MKVRAKFKVTRTEHYEGGMSAVSLTPVTSGSEENKQFFKATPSGEIVLRTVNEHAAEQFTPGAEFYVDFTPALEEAP